MLHHRFRVEIVDDDTATLGLSAETTTEGDAIEVSVEVAEQTNSCVIPVNTTVTLTASGDTGTLTDASPRTVQIRYCTKTVTATFPTRNDDTDTGDRHVTFTLSNLQGAPQLSSKITADAATTVRVRDDDGAPNNPPVLANPIPI